MKTVSSNHVAADQVFRSITGLPHLHVDFSVWCILMPLDAARGFGSGVEGAPCVALTGFCNVSFPLPPLCGFLEAAQRRVISHRECHVQELAVLQDHQLHRRGESPPAQRAGPLAGNCTRGGTTPFFLPTEALMLFLCRLIVPHLTVLMVLSPRSDCVKGERSAGVEEKVRGQPAGSGGDEVRGRAGVYQHLPVFLLNGKVSQCVASCLQAPPIITF